MANMNITLNGTQLFGNCPSSSNPTTENIGKTFVYCIICVVSLVGNTLIGIIVCKTRTMRKPINSLIVNMAISDMLFPLFGFPWILTELFVDSWLISGSLGQATCKLLTFLQGISPTVSVQSLVLIAADRFGAVVFPLSYRVRSSKLYLILATWMIAIAIQFPYILAFKVVKYPDRLVCRPMWNEVFGASFKNHYFVAFSIVFIFIPLVLISILYIIIYLKFKSQKIPGEQSQVKVGQQRERRERNVLRMAIAIVIGFAICWLPITVSRVLLVFASHTTTSSCGFIALRFSASVMAFANSAINPCICFIFSANYRQGLQHLFSRTRAGIKAVSRISHR